MMQASTFKLYYFHSPFSVDEKKPVSVILHAVPQSGVFKLNRFHVDKNNIRSSWYKGQGQTEDTTASGM